MKYIHTILILLTVLFSFIPAWAGLSQMQVSELYVTIFGRASEGSGNTYWQSQPDMASAATEMLNTPAAKNYFGSSLDTNQAFIEHIYKNTLNKTVQQDAQGISHWVGALDAGSTRGEVVATLINAMSTYAPGSPYYTVGRDAQLTPEQLQALAAYNRFQNRVTVSNYMADTVWPTPADWETSTAFSPAGLNVTDDKSTVNNAKRSVDHLKDITPAIQLSQTAISLEAGESATISISGGSGSYSVVNSNTRVASAWISGSSLEIAGLSEGTITLVVTDTGGASADVTVRVAQFICGAYVAPGVWKEFDCYNLAAIGKETGADPFTPSWELNGGYWQWGRKGPDSRQWYDTNTSNFAHGPVGIGIDWGETSLIYEIMNMDAVAYGFDPLLAVNVTKFSFDYGGYKYTIADTDLEGLQGYVDYLEDLDPIGAEISTYNQLVDRLNYALADLVAHRPELDNAGLAFSLGNMFEATHPRPDHVPNGNLTGIQIVLTASGHTELTNGKIAIDPAGEDLFMTDPDTGETVLIRNSARLEYQFSVDSMPTQDPEQRISEANSGEISGWDDDYAPAGSWSDEHKTANDPCLAGYRVPTIAQWEGIIDNNTQSTLGTWDSNPTNYSSARFFGSDLMLPAAGYRIHYSGALSNSVRTGGYWSSSESSSSDAWSLAFLSGAAGTNGFSNRLNGLSVRCVAE